MSIEAPRRYEFSPVIANGASLSDAMEIGGLTPVGLWTPAAWTAAAISFLVSRDGSAWADAFDDLGAEVSIPSASIPTNAARRFALNARLFLGVRFVQLRSGLTGSTVNQGAARSLVLVVRAGL
jgi:hypothetical protein